MIEHVETTAEGTDTPPKPPPHRKKSAPKSIDGHQSSPPPPKLSARRRAAQQRAERLAEMSFPPLPGDPVDLLPLPAEPPGPPITHRGPTILPLPDKSAQSPIQPSSGPARPLPTPIKFDFTDEPALFFKYWKSLAPEELNRALVYVYRNWPVWDPTLLLNDEEREAVRRKELRVVTNIGKLNQPWDPKHWEHEIYHRWGAGDYHLKLNDTHKNFAKTICMVTVRGLRDFDNYPPVLDARAVVMTDPANASYIERARLKGKRFPGDPGLMEEEMGSEALKELTGTVDKLAGRLADQGNRPAAPDVGAHAQLKAVESVAEGARQGMKIMGDAISSAESARAKSQDPKEYLRDTIEMAKLLVPHSAPAPAGENPLAGMMKIMETMMQMQMQHSKDMMDELRGRLAFTERMLIESRTAQAQPPQAPNPTGAPTVTPGPRSFLDDLDRLIAVKDKLESLTGGGGGDGPPGWVPYAMQGLGIVATAAANITHNLAVARTGNGTAVPPPAMPGLAEQPEAADTAQPQPPGPSPEQEKMNFIQFAQRLHRPLVNALEQGIPGTTFGAQMILHEGAMTYHYLASMGKDGIVSVLQLYLPIWQDVLKVPQQFDRFLDEFLQSDQVHALAEEMRLAAADAQAPPEPPPPPRASAPPRAPAPPTQAPRPPQAATGERRTVSGPGGKPVEVIAPRPTPPAPAHAHVHRGPAINTTSTPVPPPPAAAPEPKPEPPPS